MSYRELSMIEVKEVLRRREAGQALREIARETGLDRKTVRRYVEAAGETDGEVDTEVVVQQVVQAVQVRAPQPPSEPRGRIDAHRELITSWLKPAEGYARVAAHQGARAAQAARRGRHVRHAMSLGARRDRLA